MKKKASKKAIAESKPVSKTINSIKKKKLISKKLLPKKAAPKKAGITGKWEVWCNVHGRIGSFDNSTDAKNKKERHLMDFPGDDVKVIGEQ